MGAEAFYAVVISLSVVILYLRCWRLTKRIERLERDR